MRQAYEQTFGCLRPSFFGPWFLLGLKLAVDLDASFLHDDVMVLKTYRVLSEQVMPHSCKYVSAELYLAHISYDRRSYLRLYP